MGVGPPVDVILLMCEESQRIEDRSPGKADWNHQEALGVPDSSQRVWFPRGWGLSGSLGYFYRTK